MNSTDFPSRHAVLVSARALLVLSLMALMVAPAALAQAPSAGQAPATAPHGGGEASLKLPDLGQASFVGVNGRTLLMAGLGICLLGLVFGLVIYTQLKSLPVHESMREISELIYETCKTYLINQGKFLLVLECSSASSWPSTSASSSASSRSRS